MRLEQQLARLAEIGLPLADGITIDDVLFSFSRDQYEKSPFGLILFVLGIEVEREPWGRFVCQRAWNFDTECIYQTGDYVSIVTNLSRVADAEARISDVRDHVDLSAGEGWLEYTCDGVSHRRVVEVVDDWADTITLCDVMADIERDGWRFYYKDNGQAMVLYYLDEGRAETLNQLAPGAIAPMLSSV